jgi:hypothetical protein
MQLRLSIYQTIYQECSLCRENLIGSHNPFNGSHNPFNQTNNYSACPNCKQDVSKETESDKNYRKRWKRFVNKSKDTHHG